MVVMVDDDDDGRDGDDDGVIMPTMTIQTARIQLLKLFLIYFEEARFADICLI